MGQNFSRFFCGADNSVQQPKIVILSDSSSTQSKLDFQFSIRFPEPAEILDQAVKLTDEEIEGLESFLQKYKPNILVTFEKSEILTITSINKTQDKFIVKAGDSNYSQNEKSIILSPDYIYKTIKDFFNSQTDERIFTNQLCSDLFDIGIFPLNQNFLLHALIKYKEILKNNYSSMDSTEQKIFLNLTNFIRYFKINQSTNGNCIENLEDLINLVKDNQSIESKKLLQDQNFGFNEEDLTNQSTDCQYEIERIITKIINPLALSSISSITHRTSTAGSAGKMGVNR